MIQAVATLPLSSRHRVSQVLFHDSQPYVAVQSHDRSIEVFRIRTEDEARKKQARRRKRAKEKEEKSKPKEKDLVDKAGDEDIGVDEIGLVDLFTPYLVIRASGKVRSFDFSTKDATGHKARVQVSCLLGQGGIRSHNIQILLALASNALEVYDIPSPPKSKDQVPEASRIYSLDIPGHRTDVRTLCLSSDDQILASASNGGHVGKPISVPLMFFVGTLKLWNVKTTACIRTMDCGYAVCSTFLPGDRHVRIVAQMRSSFASYSE